MSKKFKRVVLHFGGDKTGSTAIQTALNTTRDLLLKGGRVAYAPGVWHSQFASYFCDAPELFAPNLQYWGQVDRKFIREVDQRYINELERFLKNAPKCETLAFSFEGFVSLDSAAMQKLKAYCANLAEKVQVVIYVRPPFSYAISAMSQRVKQGRMPWSAGDPPIFAYKSYLDIILPVFGKENLIVKKFSRDLLLNSDVIDDLLATLGATTEEISTAKQSKIKSNESLSWPALKVGEAIIAAFAEKKIDLTQGQFLERFGQHLTEISGERIQLDAQQAEELIFATAEHSEYIKREFSVDLSEDSSSHIRKINGREGDEGKCDLLASFGTYFAATIAGATNRPSNYAAPEFSLINLALRSNRTIRSGAPLLCEIEFSVSQPINELDVGIHVFDQFGRKAFGTNSSKMKKSIRKAGAASYKAHCLLTAQLPDGLYTAAISVAELSPKGNRRLAWQDNLITFQVESARPVQSDGYSALAAEIVVSHAGSAIRPIKETKGHITIQETPSTMPAGAVIDLPVKLHNASSENWAGTYHQPLCMCYHWLDANGSEVVFDGLRTPIPANKVRAGESRALVVRIATPAERGRFRLVLLPLQERCFWFDQKGFTPTAIDLDIE